MSPPIEGPCPKCKATITLTSANKHSECPGCGAALTILIDEGNDEETGEDWTSWLIVAVGGRS